jgi:hypothetical protein
MVACAAVALLARDASPALQAVALCASVAALAALAVWLDLRWSRVTGGAQG